MPASSAICASLRLSGQLPDQRSGTSVTARPDEQLAPNNPILSLFALCIDMRSWREGAGASTGPPEVWSGAADAREASRWRRLLEWPRPNWLASTPDSGENLPGPRNQPRRRKSLIRINATLTVVIVAAWVGMAPAQEQTSYPNRPIHLIVPFPAGGPSDIVARLIGQRMSEDWGQPVVIENRPGANTIIGAQAAAKAAGDGYTLFMAIDSTLVMNQYLYKSLPYDPFNDFAPISLTAKTVSVLAVSAASGLATVRDLIARAKA